MARLSSRKNRPVTSLRLWRQIAQLDTTDPIALRASQMRKPVARARRRLRFSRALILIASVAASVCIAIAPQLIILLFALPMALITLMVASPLLLPIATWVFGAALIAGIVSGIHREKRQHTYELLCNSTAGALHANLSFAAGILHRGGWFAILRWGSLATLRGGSALLILLALLILWQLAAAGVGMEQARLLIVPSLLLLLYYAHLMGTMTLGLCLGLLCAGLPLAKPDATMFGICAYIAATALPIASGALLYLAGRALLLEGDAASLLVLEAAAALCVIGMREAAWRLAWRGVVATLPAEQPAR